MQNEKWKSPSKPEIPMSRWILRNYKRKKLLYVLTNEKRNTAEWKRGQNCVMNLLTYQPFSLVIWALNLPNIWGLEFPLWKNLVGLFLMEPRGKWIVCLDIWHLNDWSANYQLQKIIRMNISLILKSYNMLLLFQRTLKLKLH